MIFLILGLILFGLWYLADKTLGERFHNYLKWLSLAVIVFFVLFDINLMLETNRLIDVREANPLGLSYTDPVNNVTSVVYGSQTPDTGTIVSYHYAELALWPVFTGLLPAAFIGIGGFIVMQIVSMWYDEYTGYRRRNDGKDSKEKRVYVSDTKRD